MYVCNIYIYGMFNDTWLTCQILPNPIQTHSQCNLNSKFKACHAAWSSAKQRRSSPSLAAGISWADIFPPCNCQQQVTDGTHPKSPRNIIYSVEFQHLPSHCNFSKNVEKNLCGNSKSTMPFFIIWVCLKMGYTPNYSHLVGIMIINHWV